LLAFIFSITMPGVSGFRCFDAHDAQTRDAQLKFCMQSKHRIFVINTSSVYCEFSLPRL